MGYSSPASGSDQPSPSSVRNVGLLLKVGPKDSPLTNHFYTPVLTGIESICRQHHINLFYTHLPVDEDNYPLEVPRLVQEESVDGFFIVGAWLREVDLPAFESAGRPLVLVDAYAVQSGWDAVVTDNIAGAYQAVQYLIEKGHRQIAVVGSLPEGYPSLRERRQGYIQAMTEHQLPLHFIDSHLYIDAATQAVLLYLEEHPEITALFCCNDEIAIGIMSALQERGYRLPEDISVMGFDNIAMAQHVTPALTTMRVDKMGMGRLAAQLLIQRAENPDTGQVRVEIRPSLIERQSVAGVAHQK